MYGTRVEKKMLCAWMRACGMRARALRFFVASAVTTGFSYNSFCDPLVENLRLGFVYSQLVLLVSIDFLVIHYLLTLLRPKLHG